MFVTNKKVMNLDEVISVVTLKRTDTTLDLSQKAKRFGFFKRDQEEKYKKKFKETKTFNVKGRKLEKQKVKERK